MEVKVEVEVQVEVGVDVVNLVLVRAPVLMFLDLRNPQTLVLNLKS